MTTRTVLLTYADPVETALPTPLVLPTTEPVAAQIDFTIPAAMIPVTDLGTCKNVIWIWVGTRKPVAFLGNTYWAKPFHNGWLTEDSQSVMFAFEQEAIHSICLPDALAGEQIQLKLWNSLVGVTLLWWAYAVYATRINPEGERDYTNITVTYHFAPTFTLPGLTFNNTVGYGTYSDGVLGEVLYYYPGYGGAYEGGPWALGPMNLRAPEYLGRASWSDEGIWDNPAGTRWAWLFGAATPTTWIFQVDTIIEQIDLEEPPPPPPLPPEPPSSASGFMLEYSLDGVNYVDISGMACEVALAGGERGVGEAYRYPADTAAIIASKRGPVGVTIRLLYQEETAFPCEVFRQAMEADQRIWLRWAPLDKGGVGHLWYTTDPDCVIQDFGYPDGEAGPGEPMMVALNTRAEHIITSVKTS